jgi:hypothetical protein
MPCYYSHRWEAVGLNTLIVQVMLQQGHFRSKIDRNFTFRILMNGVAACWAPIAHGTSTPARACPMVGSTGCAWLGCGLEGHLYFRSQSIIIYFHSNSVGSLHMCASCAVPLTHPTHIMSRPGHLPCTLWKFSNDPWSFGQLSSPLSSHLSPQSAVYSGCHCYSVCAWARTLLYVKDKLSQGLLAVCEPEDSGRKLLLRMVVTAQFKNVPSCVQLQIWTKVPSFC